MVLNGTGFEYYFDQLTKTAIGYLTSNSTDGWMPGGTWATFNDRNSIQATVEYISKTRKSTESYNHFIKIFPFPESKELSGAFVFDIADDTVDHVSGQFSYNLTSFLHEKLQDGSHPQTRRICHPPAKCNVCNACCKSFLTNQRDCNACAVVRCGKDPP